MQNKDPSISMVILKDFDISLNFLRGGTKLFDDLDWVGLKGSQVFYLTCCTVYNSGRIQWRNYTPFDELMRNYV